MVRLLWENESELCSYITDIQHQGFGNKADYSIFFLETILVPPIKFRPPSKGGDSVSLFCLNKRVALSYLDTFLSC